MTRKARTVAEPDLVDALRSKMGDESQVRFAARLGIDQSGLSKLLARHVGVGPKVAGAILREFPELHDAVIRALTHRLAA